MLPFTMNKSLQIPKCMFCQERGTKLKVRVTVLLDFVHHPVFEKPDNTTFWKLDVSVLR
jgi:hypothetical protein